MARAVGIDVDRLFTATFVMGCALAGFGGVIGAELLPLEPFYALRYLVIFLVVVTVGGLGSFRGSLAAAIVLGVIDTAGKFLFPDFAAFLLFGLVFLLLLWRPNGILPPKSAA
jgi:branched-chain amino acid transport system permease protein